MLYGVKSDTLDAGLFEKPNPPIFDVVDHFWMIVIQITIHEKIVIPLLFVD